MFGIDESHGKENWTQSQIDWLTDWLNVICQPNEQTENDFNVLKNMASDLFHQQETSNNSEQQ